MRVRQNGRFLVRLLSVPRQSERRGIDFDQLRREVYEATDNRQDDDE
jgi:hypothetical protein